MESMRTSIVVWLSGLVAGLILMERWRRLGDSSGATAETVDDVTNTAAARREPVDKPNALNSIVAGATAEAERARQLLTRVVPWATKSSDPLAGTGTTATAHPTGSFADDSGSATGVESRRDLPCHPSESGGNTVMSPDSTSGSD